MDALRDEAAGYQPLGAGFGTSEPGPAASSGAAAGAFPVDEALIGRVWGMFFDRIAVSKGAHWSLTAEEENQLGAMTKPVLAKYMPAVMSKYGEELALVACVGMICAAKMMKGPNEGV